MPEKLLNFQLIDIVSTQSPEPRSKFSTEEIETLAQNFLKTGGNITPLIVKRISLEEFEVVEGHLEFYAAKRAREIDKFFEMIRAIILDKKNEEGVRDQLKLIGSNQPPINPTPISSDVSQLIANLDKNISQALDELRREIKEQARTINQLINKPKQKSYLEQFNTSTVSDLVTILDRKGGLKQKDAKTVATLIVEARQQKPFSSLLDITNKVFKTAKTGRKTRAITEKTMLDIIDSWSQADSELLE